MLTEVRKWFEPWYYKYGVIVLAAAIGLGAYEWINWSCLSASDWGTWVGAIGTVATLIGTIWIATETGRRQRADERDRAFVAASGLLLQLKKVQAALESGVDHFSDRTFASNGFKYAVQAQIIRDAKIWNEAQVLPLIAIPNHIAARLAHVRAEVLDIIEDLDEMERIKGYSWVEETKSIRDQAFLDRIADNSDTVSYCIKECRAFMRAVDEHHRRSMQ